MLSKNNRKLQERKLEQKQRFGFRKYSFGLASALIGVSFMLTTGGTVSADTTTPAETPVAAAATTSSENTSTSGDATSTTASSESTDTKSSEATDTASTTATSDSTATASSESTDSSNKSTAADSSDTKAENTTSETSDSKSGSTTTDSATDTAKTASTESTSSENKTEAATSDSSADQSASSAASNSTSEATNALRAAATATDASVNTTDASTTTATDDSISSEGKITDEGKAKGLTDSDVTPGMSDADGASLVLDKSKIPSGYKADPTEGRYTFGIVSLGEFTTQDGTTLGGFDISADNTTYNGTHDTKYYLRFSTSKTAVDGKYDDTVYAEVVNAATGETENEYTLTPNGTATISELENLVKINNSIHHYQLTYTVLNNNGVSTKQIDVNSDVGTQYSKVIYDAGNGTNTSSGTVVHVMYPGESTITTQYIAKDAAGNETVLANYEETGREGFTYTASGERSFKGYDLISAPSSTTGTLSASYKIGDLLGISKKQLSKYLQIARVHVVTDTDGTAKVELRVASLDASLDDIADSSIWKTILSTEPIAPGEFGTNGNVNADGNPDKDPKVAFLLQTLSGDKIGWQYVLDAGFTEEQLEDSAKYLTIFGLNNRLSAGQEPAKYYYAPQGQVRINYVTSDGTVIQSPVSAYENSGTNTSYNVTGSTYRPETITVNGKTYRYVKSDKSMGTAGTTEVNGYTYNLTPSDATGTITSNTVNDVYYVYEQVKYHTEAETRDVTRTIEYYDSVTGEPIPSNLESTVTQTATLNRNKIYDDQNNFVGYGTISADGSSYTINDSWTVDEKKKTWPQKDSADLSDYGYTAPDRASVAAVTVDGNTTDVTEKVYYGHQTQTITPNDPNPVTPGEPINPNDPNSPVYGEETDRKNLVKDASQTIHYVGAGDKTPADNVVTQKDAFTRSVTIDKVTGKVLSYTDWEGEKTFNTVDTPVVDGYHADKKVAGGLTATVDNPDVEETVTYSPNGKLIPVDPNGTPIPGADTPTYPTDPNDPTKVVPNEPIPEVPGWNPVDPSPVTPTNPGEDTPVHYNQVVTGTIKYVDDTTGKTLSSEDLPEGTVGSKINYTTENKIKSYEDQGYELVSTDFSDGKEVYAKEGNDFVVHLKHDTKEVVSYKDATQTIHYVGAGDNTPADKVQTQKDVFTKTDTIDKVTGEVIETTGWTGTKTFGTEDTPVVDGYHADKKIAGGLTATIDNPDVEETVTYSPNGKLIPVDPNGTPIPGADTPTYPTDPNDPTKVVPNEPVPDVPGWNPVDPSPVTPSNPGEDTPVPYNQVVTGTIKYVDDTTGKTLSSKDLPEGTVGSKINYTTADKIKNYEDQGYELVSNDFTDGSQVYAKDGNDFVVHLKHATEQTTSYKDASQTIHYVGAGDDTPADKVQTQKDAFSKTDTIDKVTGEVIETTGWTGTKTFGTEDTPVVDGYHADKKVAGGLTATVDNPDVEETVTYSPNGKLVPVDPNGTPIPGADTPTYPTDPNDPTKVVPNEPIPDVPNWTPVDPSPVTPTNPGEDTPVPYTKNETPEVKYGLTEKFVDEDGNELLPSVNKGTDYKTGDSYDVTKDAKVVEGYVLVKTTDTTGTFTDSDKTAVFTYKKVGKIVPVDPNGNEIPGADTPSYKNDPDDPTKVVPNEPTPEVPGWTTDVPNVTPEDPTKDTPVPCTKNETPEVKYGLTEKFVDEEGNELLPSVNKGTDYKTGDSYDVTKDAKVVEGYVLVKTTDTTGTFTDGNKTAVFTYKKVGKIVPVDPNGNEIPGADTPSYKNDPDDPTKVVPNEPTPEVPGWTTDVPNVTPEDPTKDTPVPYTKKTTPETPSTPETPAAKYGLTEKFVDENGNELQPSVNKGTDYKTGDSYDVTDDAKVVEGYVLVKTTDTTGTFTDGNKTAVFTYKKIGKIIPVDENGTPIPGADTPSYKNDPTDPTKVLPNEPTPEVPGWTTDVPNVTPADPTADTPVPYAKKTTPSAPEVPSTPDTPSNPEEPTTPDTPSNPETPTTPDKPEVPSQPQKPATPSGQNNPTPVNPTTTPASPKQTTLTGKQTPAPSKTVTANQLPQTGADEEKAILLSALGLGLVTLTSLFGLLGGKKRKH